MCDPTPRYGKDLEIYYGNMSEENPHIQRAYVGAVRTYFETGFRRYIRSLGWIKVSSLDIYLKPDSYDKNRHERQNVPKQ